MRSAARDEAGFTLVEVLVAVGLFALIASAGLAMLDTVARVQTGTQGRLDRLAALQRAEALLTEDLSALAGARVEGGSETLRFIRLDRGGAPVAVAYRLEEDRLLREIAGRTQTLLAPAGAVRFRVYADGAWRAPEDLEPGAEIALVELVMSEPNDAQTIALRRVVRPPQGPGP